MRSNERSTPAAVPGRSADSRNDSPGRLRRKAKTGLAREVSWIYRRLLRRFGPQGWWPVTPPGAPSPRYLPRCTAGRLSSRERFEICLGAILTQNTAWTNVERALVRLHGERAVDCRRLTKMPFGRLAGLIRSSGYFRQKAARLKGFCRHLLKRWDGDVGRLLSQPLTQAREELLSLNGIGPETADSMVLYAGPHASFVVDAYTRRFGRRYGLFGTDEYHRIQELFRNCLPESAPLYREYHALIVALGKEHCRSAPRCGGCPLVRRCRWGKREKGLP
ncbi:MAG TPA: endonuclease III domain-containing protein [Elusimicrobiota bacterium]|nr:endonuclease III domain-containing protein [Elusimicrobiota bacterium]